MNDAILTAKHSPASRMKLIFAIASLLCLATASAQTSFAPAVPVLPAPITTPGNPYEALVPLTERGAAGQDAAMREALFTVLTAVSGLPDARAEPLAIPIVAQASQLALHYGAEEDPVTRLPLFRVAFDARAVDAALKRQGLPVGGRIAGAEQEWALIVRGINSYQDYARATGSLRKLRGVKSLQVLAAEADQLSLRIRFEGDSQTLARAILEQGHLRATPQPAGHAANQTSTSLVFMLVSGQ